MESYQPIKRLKEKKNIVCLQHLKGRVVFILRCLVSHFLKTQDPLELTLQQERDEHQDELEKQEREEHEDQLHQYEQERSITAAAGAR